MVTEMRTRWAAVAAAVMVGIAAASVAAGAGLMGSSSPLPSAKAAMQQEMEAFRSANPASAAPKRYKSPHRKTGHRSRLPAGSWRA